MRRPRADAVGWVLLAGLGACDNTPPPAPAPGMDAATPQQLFDRLDRRVAALEAIPRASGTVAVPVEATAERTPAADKTGELEARIDALEREVALLHARSGSSFAPARASPVLPTQTHVVEQTGGQLRSKDEAVKQEARRSLFRLTQAQVLERFGMPRDTAVTKEGHVSWSYGRGDSYFHVTFIDGLANVID